MTEALAEIRWGGFFLMMTAAYVIPGPDMLVILRAATKSRWQVFLAAVGEFQDVAALVAYLQLVPWETPEDFTVDCYAERLLAVHRETSGGPVRLTRKRFWMRAVRG